MRKRHIAFKNKNSERVRSLKRQISADIRKAKLCFYANEVGPNLKNHPKSWWKQFKCLIGRKNIKATMLDPTTGHQMDDKQSACYKNNLFANLTKNYPKVNEDWLNFQCTENLPLITVN